MIYPQTDADRNRWIVAQRAERGTLNPQLPYAFFNEQERSANGSIEAVSTIFLTNRECPWHCLMCDLWKNTLPGPVRCGDIPAQIDHALSRLPTAAQLKLYNSGSFFDRQAIPREDYRAIADRAAPFNRIVVESHPSLIGEPTFAFRDALSGHLEVAMGLETVQEDVLQRLNKRMTLQQFAAAADLLRSEAISLRAFILVKPPFTSEEEALYWAKRSIDFAFECGAGAVSLLPVRANNGAMEILQDAGLFSPPRLQTVEAAMTYGLSLDKGRVFTDLWDLRKSANCCDCTEARVEHLHAMNLHQRWLEPMQCDRGVDCLA